MASWPTTLPQSPLVNGYSRQPVDSRLISMPDAGKGKIRNRYTAVPIDVNEVYLLTLDQYAIFVDFYNDIISYGADEFLKVDPITGLTKNHRFREEMYTTNFKYPYMEVSLSLEVMP